MSKKHVYQFLDAPREMPAKVPLADRVGGDWNVRRRAGGGLRQVARRPRREALPVLRRASDRRQRTALPGPPAC